MNEWIIARQANRSAVETPCGPEACVKENASTQVFRVKGMLLPHFSACVKIRGAITAPPTAGTRLGGYVFALFGRLDFSSRRRTPELRDQRAMEGQEAFWIAGQGAASQRIRLV